MGRRGRDGNYGHRADMMHDRRIGRLDNQSASDIPAMEEGSAAVDLEVEDLAPPKSRRGTREDWKRMRVEQGKSPYPAGEQPKPGEVIYIDDDRLSGGGVAKSVDRRPGRRSKKKR
ncbi:hypothetical protein HOF40_03600 [Candidatus Parcubacteria bacterium]|nr:hypothetical protein [Candidatus Parcubacteria bacterium]MBT3949146.1 hypothetical protein [Candidatus Parcubacteria bacterium]